MKIGIFKLSRKKKPSHRDANNNEKKDSNDPFNGYNPILIIGPDFQIGYSLVYRFTFRRRKIY